MSNSKLLLAALVGLASSNLVHALPSLGTVSNHRRFKHRSEAEQEKLDAKRRDIAEWNARLEKQK